MSEHVECSQEVETIAHITHTIRCMRCIRPHDWHEHAYQLTSGRCRHRLLATRSAEQNLGLASIQVQLGEQQSEDVARDVLISPSLILRCAGYQADARRGRSYGSDEFNTAATRSTGPSMPDPSGILHISLIRMINHIIPCRQHHQVCHQTVQWIHRCDKIRHAQRQKQSISSSSGLNRLGGDVTFPHPRSHPFLDVLLSHPKNGCD